MYGMYLNTSNIKQFVLTNAPFLPFSSSFKRNPPSASGDLYVVKIFPSIKILISTARNFPALHTQKIPQSNWWIVSLTVVDVVGPPDFRYILISSKFVVFQKSSCFDLANHIHISRNMIIHRSDSNQASDFTTSLISGFKNLKCVFGEELFFLSNTIFRYQLCLHAM